MSKLALDANSNPIQVLRPGATELETPSGSAVSATAVAAGVQCTRIVADADIHYSLVGTATTSDVYLPSGTVEYIRVQAGDVISVIGTANVHLTAMG